MIELDTSNLIADFSHTPAERYEAYMSRNNKLESRKIELAKATIKYPYGGQGVLIPGGYILTASHCILDPNDNNKPLCCDCALLNDPIILEVKFGSEASFKVMPLFVDAISDVAVLGPPDHPDLFREAHAFEKYCELILPAKISCRALPAGKNCRASIHTHDRGWVEAKVTSGFGNSLAFEAESIIEGGTSGGPIIDSRGKVIGVVSESSMDDGSGRFSFAYRCLPVWLSDLIL